MLLLFGKFNQSNLQLMFECCTCLQSQSTYLQIIWLTNQPKLKNELSLIANQFLMLLRCGKFHQHKLNIVFELCVCLCCFADCMSSVFCVM